MRYDRLTVGVSFFPELECLRVRGEIPVPFVAQRSRSVGQCSATADGWFSGITMTPIRFSLLAGTIFFSHNNSARIAFFSQNSTSQTEPISRKYRALTCLISPNNHSCTL